MADPKSGYITQTDDQSCGPVAILNALNWLRRNPSQRPGLARLRRECGTCTTGSPFGQVRETVFRHLRPKAAVVLRHNPDFREIVRRLDEGQAMIFRWKHPWCEGGHMAFAYRGDRRGIRIVNGGHPGQPAVHQMSGSTMRRLLRRRFSFAFFIRRRI